MIIKGFDKLTLLDYPGHVACIVFLAGCNFRCGFCYNKELVFNKTSLQSFSEDEIFSYLAKRKNVLEGVCVTGGEPTLNLGLPDFLEKIKKLGLKVKLDTNGTLPKMVETLLEKKLVDYFAVDIKASFGEKYQELAGLTYDPTSLLSESLLLISSSGVDYELRTTIIPDFHTAPMLKAMAKNVQASLAKTYDLMNLKWYLQPFIPGKCLDSEFNHFQPCTTAFISELIDQASTSSLRFKARQD